MIQEPLPLTVYGGIDCDDTEHVSGRLDALGIPFRAVMLEDDPEAERFVVFINGGFRSTPTLVFGREKFRILITEPSDAELETTLRLAGHAPAAQQNGR